MYNAMSVFIALLIVSTVPVIQSNYCLTFDTCICMSDYMMECLNIPVDLPHQQHIPCTITELQILMEDPDELEYLENGHPNLTRLYSFISNVKTAKMNATFRPMMPYLFTIKITTETSNNPCFPPHYEQSVMIYCTPRNPTMQSFIQSTNIDQRTYTLMQIVATELVTNIPAYNQPTDIVMLNTTGLHSNRSTTPILYLRTQDEPLSIPSTTSATPILSKKTEEDFHLLPSTTSGNLLILSTGIVIGDGQKDYEDNNLIDELAARARHDSGLIDEHKVVHYTPPAYQDHDNPPTSSAQPPSYPLDNVHLMEWFSAIEMIIIFALLGLLTVYYRRSLRQQHTVSNRQPSGSYGIEECTVFELLER